MDRTVTLVDETGKPLGEAPILEAHTGEGKLHKAFSVYVFNKEKTKVLVQKRAEKKMLFAGIWCNTCCSHPFKDEAPQVAGERRLKEELGFTVPLREAQETFVYRALDPNGKGVEHEHVTLLIGEKDERENFTVNPDEVAEWKWVDIQEIQKDFEKNADTYALWFTLGLPKVLASL